MGKKSGDKQAKEKAREFLLRVDMHCKCDGCIDKIRAAVKDITSHHQGIQSWDHSALDTKGELRLLATADPEKLQQRLRKATRKNVDLLFPTVPKGKEQAGGNSSEQGNKDAAAQVQALLLNSLQQQQQQNAASWSWANTNQNQLLLGGGGWYGGYPSSWALQQPADPYAAYYPAAAGPGGGGASWGGGAYSAAYPPLGAYGWHGY